MTSIPALSALSLASRITGIGKAVPSWAWKVLGIIAAVVSLYLVHQHYAHKAIAEAVTAARLD